MMRSYKRRKRCKRCNFLKLRKRCKRYGNGERRMKLDGYADETLVCSLGTDGVLLRMGSTTCTQKDNP